MNYRQFPKPACIKYSLGGFREKLEAPTRSKIIENN